MLEQMIWKIAIELNIESELRAQIVELFTDRLDTLITHYCPEEQIYAKRDKKARTGETAAGILTYTFIDDKPYILLSKRAGHEWWDNFGGKSELQDTYLEETAIKEVEEEIERASCRESVCK